MSVEEWKIESSSMNSGVESDLESILTLSHPTFWQVTKSLKPQCLHLHNEETHSLYLLGLLWRLDEIKYT